MVEKVVDAGVSADDDLVFRDEIEACDVYCGLLIGCDYDVGVLDRYPQPVMMKVSLKPVIRVVPVCKITEIFHFYDLMPILVCVFLHLSVKLMSCFANLI